MNPSWLIGDVLKKCGVPCAEEIAMMLAKETDEPVVPEANSYITFASAEPFTLAVEGSEKHWDGTIYYTTYHGAWSVWDGETTLVSAENGSGEQRLYLRGVGNSKITTVYYGQSWILTGNNVHCRGNIENLLDYETVAIGQHPTMAEHCFAGLFDGCTNLVSAPELPATTLTDYCYLSMFDGCTSLVALPKLPATNLPDRCYQGMFDGCTNIKVSTTPSNEYHTAYRIPTDGGGTVGYNSMHVMFRGTGGTFTGDPQINSTYYTSNEVI